MTEKTGGNIDRCNQVHLFLPFPTTIYDKQTLKKKSKVTLYWFYLVTVAHGCREKFKNSFGTLFKQCPKNIFICNRPRKSFSVILSFSSVQCEKIWGIMGWLRYSTTPHYINCNTQLALSCTISLLCHNSGTISWRTRALSPSSASNSGMLKPFLRSIIFNSIIQISRSILPNLPWSQHCLLLMCFLQNNHLTRFHNINVFFEFCVDMIDKMWDELKEILLFD